ncbi:hypothetical protein [Rhizobium tumorigenes]|uniref:hypothetical protein n=1 Tax=Rhizobium tumorigenes TaxID=2041385 RepID=UPI00241CA681|nr:hypothetical protein [Rhizobium tumorigenes]WFS02740.1 hypothetical protein PR016_09125 [Rhizobium tumorigenes]
MADDTVKPETMAKTAKNICRKKNSDSNKFEKCPLETSFNPVNPNGQLSPDESFSTALPALPFRQAALGPTDDD